MSTAWTTTEHHDPDLIRHETQKDRVRDLLRSAGKDGVCSLSFYALGLPNGRNRVCELRDDDGLLIETFPCDLRFHDEGTPAHVRYRWLWNGDPHQLRLLRNGI